LGGEVGVAGEIGAGADAQFQHAAAGLGQQLAAGAFQRARGPVQQRREDMVFVPAQRQSSCGGNAYFSGCSIMSMVSGGVSTLVRLRSVTRLKRRRWRSKERKLR